MHTGNQTDLKKDLKLENLKQDVLLSFLIHISSVDYAWDIFDSSYTGDATLLQADRA